MALLQVVTEEVGDKRKGSAVVASSDRRRRGDLGEVELVCIVDDESRPSREVIGLERSLIATARCHRMQQQGESHRILEVRRERVDGLVVAGLLEVVVDPPYEDVLRRKPNYVLQFLVVANQFPERGSFLPHFGGQIHLFGDHPLTSAKVSL